MDVNKYQKLMFNLYNKENWHTRKSSKANIGS